MPLTLYPRDDCNDLNGCPPSFRPANYAIIFAGLFFAISLASCFVLRNRRRRRDALPRVQHYSTGPAHIAEFIRLPPPPAGYVPHSPYYRREPQPPPVFEPAPPYDPTKGPPHSPLSSLLSPSSSHAVPNHDPSGEHPPPLLPRRQATDGAEHSQRDAPGASLASESGQITISPVEYPPPSYSRV